MNTAEAIPADIAESLANDERRRLYRTWEAVAPRRFVDADVDQLDGPLAAAAERWREAGSAWWAGDSSSARNLLLLGAVGVGKTYCAMALARRLHDRGVGWGFYPVVKLLDMLRPGADDVARTMHQAASVPVLILDDLGGEKASDWTNERLYAVINDRWLACRPTIVTSNLNAADGDGPLIDAVGPRTWSRLADDAVIARVGGADRRPEGRAL